MTKSLIVAAQSVLLLQSITTHAFNTAFVVPITNHRSTIQQQRQQQQQHDVVLPKKPRVVITAIDAATSSSSADNNSPDALMQYMAKSHEEKLRAVKDVEDRKNLEIQALKKELEETKAAAAGSSSSIVVTSNDDGSSLEELSKKLIAYQTFMSSYIVDAQEEKRKAILAAEEAITRKYEDKLSAFLLKGADDTNGVSLPDAPAKVEAPTIVEVPPEVIAADHGLRADGSVGGLTLAERVLQGAGAQSTVTTADTLDGTDDAMHPMEKLYFERNAKVSAAAKAGAHNRWGSAEEIVAAAKNGPGNVDVVGPLVLPPTPEPLPPSTELVNGSTADTTTPVSVYYKRNARIAAGADAGVHNRWMLAEEEVAKDYITNALVAGEGATSVYVVPPEVEEADHGLRADGGVGGPSLAERVNLGAHLLNA